MSDTFEECIRRHTSTKEYAEKEKWYAQKLKHLDALIRDIATPRGEASVAISDNKVFLIKMFGNEDYDISLVNTETGVCRKDITSDKLDAFIKRKREKPRF